MKTKQIAICALAFAIFTPLPSFAYKITGYGPSEYAGGTPEQLAAMVQRLGISGSVIEDFKDMNPVSGLTISGPSYGNYGNQFGNSWGEPDSHSYISYPNSVDKTIISLSPGVDLIGIGIGYMEYYGTGLYSTVTINGTTTIDFTPSTFPLFDFGVFIRNGYFSIAREFSDPLITSLTFQTVGSLYPGDAFTFDYIALQYPVVVSSLLPPKASNNAGRTMPIKFSIREASNVDPAEPFVHDENLEIRIFNSETPGEVLQVSHFGTGSENYRIDDADQLYITNFKTGKVPATYVVQIYRKELLIGEFMFTTVSKDN